jgi:hypothetical protein
MTDLTDAQVAQFLRSKAQRYLDLASDLERNGNQGVTPSLSQFSNAPQISFDDLMTELDKKQGRVSHLALRLNQSEEYLRTLLRAPNSRYYVAPRGWIKPKEATIGF